jgi:hypothetical protein
MFNRTSLDEAVDIHRRCYRLLRWVDSQMASGQFRFFTSHHSVDEIEAAEQWLLDAYAQFPDDARPPHTDKETIRKYANYFTSYLLASVNIDPSPRPRTQPDAVGCTAYFASKSHTVHTRARATLVLPQSSALPRKPFGPPSMSLPGEASPWINTRPKRWSKLPTSGA